MHYMAILVVAYGLFLPANKPLRAAEPVAFGSGGQLKMLYDQRQRPQAIHIEGMVHIVFNAGGDPSAKATKPMAITYDPMTRQFSEVVTLGPGSKDHHDGPVIWADNDDRLHVLFGCHKTPGTHLVSRGRSRIGTSLSDWVESSQIAPKLSYPTVYNIAGSRQMIYYRTDGHPSSWTYRITSDNGRTWSGPEHDVTDMDSQGRLDWSSYQTKLLSGDRKHLHVAFITYDDVKTDPDPNRFYNARYGKEVSNEWKYNLYYIRIELETQVVTNFDGDPLQTPIHLDQADSACRIWDTEGRGAGVPPTLIEDTNGDPAFLHVLSEETTDKHNYYYYHRCNGDWKATRIASSNHQWNSCHLSRRRNGTLDAYLVRGEGYLDSDGEMDKHGGGRIEQWSSTDKGETWSLTHDITQRVAFDQGWKFNNPRAVTRADGSPVEGMLLYYGWKDKDARDAKAFLLHSFSHQH